MNDAPTYVFARRRGVTSDCYDVDQKTIQVDDLDGLPDDALLEIFGFYVEGSKSINEWHTLIHVCRRWRSIVFGSPRRLKLQLECIPRKPLRKTLEVWPPFPMVINGEYYSESSAENIMAMLRHNDRVCEINLRVLSTPLSENIMTAMQEQFPILTSLRLCFADKTTSAVPADPESFLGGSAPSLQSLSLEGIPFPGLPSLLLTATHLVHLNLSNIPHSGYFMPISIVVCLSTLVGLESLRLQFESPRSRPDWHWRLHLPRTRYRSDLPALTSFLYKGTSEYLEDLVARINAPQLADFHTTFFNQLSFDTPELSQFIERTPAFGERDKACVEFYDSCVGVTLPQANSHRLHLRVSCRPSDWQLGSLAQACASSFPQALIRMVRRLYILDGSFGLHWQDDIDKSQWLEFLQPFTGVKDLYLSWKFVPHIAPALKELIAERGTEVLPALQSIFWEGLNPSGPVKVALDKLSDARPDHPIAASYWDRAGHVFGGR
jgi:hypothetical protein